MNEKITNQIEEMKKQTIGVEVEMNSITREKAARIAAKFFGTGRYENTAGRNGYYTWSAWDEQGREWKFQRDVSIAGPDNQKCEMVTPILHYEDIETLQELIGQFNLKRMAINTEETKEGEERDAEKLRELNTDIRTIYAQIMENEHMVAYNDAKTVLDELVRKMQTAINLAVQGQDPNLAAQEISCSGDCGSCGGCH